MRRLLLIPLAAALLLLSAVPAAATPPEEVSGDWDYVPAITGIHEAGQNVFISGTDVGYWSGAFEGTSTEEFVLVHHGGAGFNYYSGVIEFTGTVNGSDPGTMIIRTVGKQIPGTALPSPEAGDWEGRWVIVAASGGLENLHGQGTFWGPSLFLEYAGQIHFEG